MIELGVVAKVFYYYTVCFRFSPDYAWQHRVCVGTLRHFGTQVKILQSPVNGVSLVQQHTQISQHVLLIQSHGAGCTQPGFEVGVSGGSCPARLIGVVADGMALTVSKTEIDKAVMTTAMYVTGFIREDS
jgi:hypothetical protein